MIDSHTRPHADNHPKIDYLLCSSDNERCPMAVEAAESAVRKVFAILGVNVDDPEKVEEFRMGLRFGQSLRRASDKGTIAVIVLIFVALAGAAWSGMIAKVAGH